MRLMARTRHATPEDFARIYARFEAPIARFDCGKKCAPLNGGEPVCCSTENAVPIVSRPEWRLLESRTDLWHRFKPFDAETRKIVDDLHSSCAAIECKGARHCERENRSLACRAFPFFPYITAAGEFVGLTTFWYFEDRCWVISNLKIVDRRFLQECCAAFDDLFACDRDEFEAVSEESASMRRVFSRWTRPIPILTREGRCLKALPHGARIVKARPTEFGPHGPYRSKGAYDRAVREAEAERLHRTSRPPSRPGA